MGLRPGGRILTDQLALQGVEHLFCVPGESFLPVLDALHEHPTIRTVTCRQEGGAAMMAEACGKLTGRPGIAFVTRGPGACNAAAGVHIASQDSTPMILFVGQVATGALGREAFQEVDFGRMFAPLAKWAAQIERTERIPEYVSRAFHVACSGRPGPVVLALPEDVLQQSAGVADVAPAHRIGIHPGADDMAALAALLGEARRPLVIAGGGGWSRAACDDLERFAERFDLPVGCSFRRQDRFNNRHGNYAGDVGIGINPKLAEHIRQADLIVCLGARLGEMPTSGYRLIEPPVPDQKLVHIHADAGELGRVYRPALAINASPGPAARALAALTPPRRIPWARWRERARADYLAHIALQETPGAVKLEQVVAHLRETLPRDAIVANGAGNYAAWVNRYYQYAPSATQLAPISGSMGYGLPAACAAKLLHPEREVVAFAGDGCLMMTVQELATAVQYELPLILIACNNAMYGTIRMHQELAYPGRVSATALRNPDFAALAESFGARGETVEHGDEFPAAFARARAAGRPALIELRLDPEALSPRLTLSETRRK